MSTEATVAVRHGRRTGTRTVYALAVNTFRESIRKKVLLALLVFSGVALGAGLIYSSRSQTAEARALIDSSISSIRFIGMLMAIFLGATSIPTEIERRTILTILAKPVTRGQFLLGKYLGIVLTVWMNVVLMSVLFIALVIYKRPEDPALYITILKALLLAACELAVVAAIAIMLATFATMTFTMICAFFVYFMGHIAEGIRYYSDPERFGLGAYVAGVLYPILPHFENFDIRQAIMSPDVIVGWRVIVLTLGSGVLYTAVLLLLGYSVFKDREF